MGKRGDARSLRMAGRGQFSKAKERTRRVDETAVFRQAGGTKIL